MQKINELVSKLKIYNSTTEAYASTFKVIFNANS
jgi:hypothetical protein